MCIVTAPYWLKLAMANKFCHWMIMGFMMCLEVAFVTNQDLHLLSSVFAENQSDKETCL